MVGNQAALSRSQECFDLVSNLENKQSLFHDMGSSYAGFCMRDLEDGEVDLITETTASQLANIITMNACDLMEQCATDNNFVKAWALSLWALRTHCSSVT